MWSRILLITSLPVILGFAVGGPDRDHAIPGPTHPTLPLTEAEVKLATVIPTIAFNHATLADALKALQREVGVNMIVDWRALEAVGAWRALETDGADSGPRVELQLKNVTLAAALRAVLLSTSTPTTHLAFSVQDNIVWVGTAENEQPSTEVYDARDLLKNRQSGAVQNVSGAVDDRAETLVRIIQDAVHPDTWRENGGQMGTIHEFNGLLVIQQTRENHRMIEALLKKIRDAIK